MRMVTLLTDFGLRDPYAGAMKGALLSVNPKARIVDISHEIYSGNIREAAYVLYQAYRYFPKGTIHTVVVDPGVGSGRKIICVKSRDYFFLAPDNGVIAPVLGQEKDFTVREVQNELYFRDKVSSTFHGRDKFAPVSGHLSMKDIYRRLGPETNRFVTMFWPKPRVEKKRISGRVIHVDRFGNLITNIDNSALEALPSKPRRLKVKLGEIRRSVEYYGAASRGELVVLTNSGGLLEIAANGASAEKKLKAKVGDKVLVDW